MTQAWGNTQKIEWYPIAHKNACDTAATHLCLPCSHVKVNKPLLKRNIFRPKFMSQRQSRKSWLRPWHWKKQAKSKNRSSQTNAPATREVQLRNRISWYRWERLKIRPHTPVCVGVPCHGCPKGPRDFCSTPGYSGTLTWGFTCRAQHESTNKSAHAGGCAILLILGRRFQIQWMFTRSRAAADDFLLWRPGCEVSWAEWAAVSQSVHGSFYLFHTWRATARTETSASFGKGKKLLTLRLTASKSLRLENLI